MTTTDELMEGRGMAKKTKEIKDPPVQEYKGKFICRVGKFYRIKSDPTLNYSLHHGSFNSAQDAKEYIDERLFLK